MAGEERITAEDLRLMARVMGLVPVPEHLMPRVLAAVRQQRANLSLFEAAGIDVADVVTAQPYRA